MTTSNAHIKLEKRISDTMFLLSVNIEKYKEWTPGMYMELSLSKKSASEPWLDKGAFSFASWGGSEAKILVRKTGDFTGALITKAIDGFEATIRYPLGRFIIVPGHNKVFLAGGAGISVFISYIDYIGYKGIKDEVIHIYHSTKLEKEGIKEIYLGQMPENVIVDSFVTGKEERKYTGRIKLDDLKELKDTFDNYQYYVCGPREFNSYWVENLKSMGLYVNVEYWEGGRIF